METIPTLSRSRAVHRVVQRAQSTLVVNAETHSNGKDELHREMDLFGDALEKTAMDKLQSARSHGFLVVTFPLKKY